MDISIQRDGLTLTGRLERASEDKGPVVILFHGMFFDLGYTEDNLYNDIVKRLLKNGIIMSTTYDTNNIPDKIAVENTPFTLGGKYFRIAKILPFR